MVASGDLQYLILELSIGEFVENLFGESVQYVRNLDGLYASGIFSLMDFYAFDNFVSKRFENRNSNYICENVIRNSKPNLLKESNNLLPSQTDRKLNVKSYADSNQKSSTKNVLENDVSLLSINDDSQNCRYFLPSSKDLMNSKVANKFSDDVSIRRNHNRDLTMDKLQNFKKEILRLSTDLETGKVFIIEILDNMIDLECVHQPLGSDFLYGTNVTIQQRNVIINNLFSLANSLSVERYSVQNGMSIFDRYIKKKGKLFNPKNLKLAYVTCWYIASKTDLLEYPCIEDVCELSKIEDPALINDFEVEVLRTIEFNLCIPTPILFLRPLSLIKQRRNVSHNIAKVISEICTAVYELAGHPSHVQACASYCLAMALSFRNLQLEDHWPPIMRFVTGIDIDDIRPLIVAIAKYLLNRVVDREFPSIYEEYETVFVVLNNRIRDLEVIVTGKI
uniref:Cyclin B-1 n=1 Tax=Schmidtea mediterranea TaxID=79327 RepID=I1ZII1_SCHMD|nr:cyclin B-1 [Schmidtea mediterranea]